MNKIVLSSGYAAGAAPYALRCYEAFRLPDGLSRPATYRLELSEQPATLAAAIDLAKVLCFHKDKLLIRETDLNRQTETLHLFAIKRESRPTRVYRDFAYHNEHRLYTEAICMIDAAVLAGKAEA